MQGEIKTHEGHMKAILIYLNIYVGSPEKKTWPNVLSI
jgi:hypothetical protein